MHVFMQHFKAKSEDRQREIDDCLYQLLTNKHVKTVYHLTETKNKNDPIFDLINQTKFKETESIKKLKIIHNNKWMFYSDAIDAAKTQVKDPDELICIINADCYLDQKTKWDELKEQLNKGQDKTIVCQTRVELPDLNIDQKFKRLAGANTQDAWFMLRKSLDSLSAFDVQNHFSFALGRLGCDNLVASKFYSLGFKLINYGSRYKVIHNDRVRNGARDYAQVDFTRLGSRLVPDYDSIVNNRVEFLQGIGIPAEEGTRIAYKIIFFAIAQQAMQLTEKLSIGQILTRLSNDDVYRLLTQILNAFVKISNT